MTPETIARWADLLAGYCLRVEDGETILLGAEVEALALVEATAKAVIARGGHPLIRLDLPAVDAFLLEVAGDEQLGRVSEVDRQEAEAIDGEARIKSLGPNRPAATIDPRQDGDPRPHRSTLRHVGKAAHRWVVTQYPTPGLRRVCGDGAWPSTRRSSGPPCSWIAPTRPPRGSSWGVGRRDWSSS